MGVCAPWSNAAAAKGCTNCATVDAGKLADMLDVASELLYRLSLYRFPGVCETTVRPCGSMRRHDGPIRFGDVGQFSWSWVTGGCGCGSGRVCGCSRVPEITLGAWPLVDITEVLVDGDVLDPSLYRIDDRRFLVRLPDPDGHNPGWPCCQNVTLDSTEVGTSEVTFTYGEAPPPPGKLAAEVLACELTLACTGGTCRLPRRVTTIVRQGVTETLLDPLTGLAEGGYGLVEVAMFLDAYGPAQSKRLPAQIVNVDIHRAVRRTGT